MKKVLFVNFNCYWNPNFETELELMHQHQLDGNKVYSLYCQGELMQRCASALFSPTKKKFCKRCQKRYKLGCKIINLPKHNRLCLQTPTSYPDYVTAKYSTMGEVRALEYDGINIGLSMFENIMLVNRSETLDLTEIKYELTTALKISYIVYSNFKRLCEELNPDAVYVFNGKHQEYEPLLSYCDKHNIDYYFHERGANPGKYVLAKNKRWHDHNDTTDIFIHQYGDSYTQADQSIGIKWFEDKREGIDKQWLSFTESQKRQLLPPGFDSKKKNITFFNSSFWEIVNYESRRPSREFIDEVGLLERVCHEFRTDKNVHIYLRVHPHLSWEPTDQLAKIMEFKKAAPENITILDPDDKIDSYELLLRSDIIVVPWGSTIGVEACFWGKPCILLAPALYETLDVCYKPANMDEFLALLHSDKLEPKPKENSYKYGYIWSTFGEDYKYYKAKDLFEGEFLGVNIKNQIKLKNKIKALLGIK